MSKKNKNARHVVAAVAATIPPTPLVDEMMKEERELEAKAEQEAVVEHEEKPTIPESQPVPAEEPKAEPAPEQQPETDQPKVEEKPAEEQLSPEMRKLTEEAPANLGGAPTTPVKIDRYPNRLKKSTASSPVKLVHSICETMLKTDPKVSRSTIQEFCIAQGIAFYTARTQVQVYFAARKRDQEAAAKAALEAAAKTSSAA